MRGLGLWICLAIALAGCVDGTAPAAGSEGETGKPARPIVVAVVDTGVNPYHSVFTSPSPAVLVETNASAFVLSQGNDYEERVGADAARFEAVARGELVAFSGTRLLAISFGHVAGGLPLIDNVDHGTGTAGLVAREAPDAVIVALQVDDTLCYLDDPSTGCPVVTSIADAVEWAAAQPWIDVISISMGIPGNPYLRGEASQEVRRVSTATRAAAEAGKLVVAAGGNSISPSATGYVAGPPWVISVGGFEPAAEGERAEAAKGVDVVANYTETLASAYSTSENRTGSGTSYAAPIVAGTLANAWGQLEARSAARDATVLRAALNATAKPVDASAYSPQVPDPTDPLAWPRTLPALAGATGGWGYVDGSILPALVDAGANGPPTLSGPRATAMSALHASREALWSSGT